jgi:uncharacterized protein DUF6328
MKSNGLSARLKVSLDELRMQMLGTQVLFGFQFQSLFQPGFARATPAEHFADAMALTAVLVSFAVLATVPAEHRLVEAGEASGRLLRASYRWAEIALATMTLAFGCVAFSMAIHAHAEHPIIVAGLAWLVAFLGWFGLGWAMSDRRSARPNIEEHEMSDVHAKIEQMLTEARVILPGVQAMLGFQLIVVMTEAFERVPHVYQKLHFVALGLAASSVVLLIAPAAVHRLAFSGEDDPRFHQIGTILVGTALIPLSFSIAADCALAAWKLFESESVSNMAAIIIACSLLGVWYALPLALRRYRVSS